MAWLCGPSTAMELAVGSVVLPFRASAFPAAVPGDTRAHATRLDRTYVTQDTKTRVHTQIFLADPWRACSGAPIGLPPNERGGLVQQASGPRDSLIFAGSAGRYHADQDPVVDQLTGDHRLPTAVGCFRIGPVRDHRLD